MACGVRRDACGYAGVPDRLKWRPRRGARRQDLGMKAGSQTARQVSRDDEAGSQTRAISVKKWPDRRRAKLERERYRTKPGLAGSHVDLL